MDDLFAKTFNHFLGYALVKMWDKSKAEDAVMSMYENVMKYIESFDAANDGMGWMFTILSRIIYNFNAEEKKIQQHEQLLTDDKYLADINQMYEAMGLSDAVSGMDDVDKRIVYQYYFERKTLDEIAQALGVGTSAIHKRKQKIIKNLKKFVI